MSTSQIFLIIAVVVFIVDALRVPIPVPINLTAVGLAFFAGSFLV